MKRLNSLTTMPKRRPSVLHSPRSSRGLRFRSVDSSATQSPSFTILGVSRSVIREKKIVPDFERCERLLKPVDQGVAKASNWPLDCRSSSRPCSARLIHSVTRSSVSSEGREEASATMALIVKSFPSHEGRTLDAAFFSFSARIFALSAEVSGKMKANDQAVYFTAMSVCRIVEETVLANCSI